MGEITRDRIDRSLGIFRCFGTDYTGCGFCIRYLTEPPDNILGSVPKGNRKNRKKYKLPEIEDGPEGWGEFNQYEHWYKKYRNIAKRIAISNKLPRSDEAIDYAMDQVEDFLIDIPNKMQVVKNPDYYIKRIIKYSLWHFAGDLKKKIDDLSVPIEVKIPYLEGHHDYGGEEESDSKQNKPDRLSINEWRQSGMGSVSFNYQHVKPKVMVTDIPGDAERHIWYLYCQGLRQADIVKQLKREKRQGNKQYVSKVINKWKLERKQNNGAKSLN
jgi:hypothetical protein